MPNAVFGFFLTHTRHINADQGSYTWRRRPIGKRKRSPSLGGVQTEPNP